MNIYIYEIHMIHTPPFSETSGTVFVDSVPISMVFSSTIFDDEIPFDFSSSPDRSQDIPTCPI